MSESLLRLDAVKSRTGLSRSEVFRRVADGSFPRPVKLSKRMAAWPASEVDEWVSTQIARRDQSNEVETTYAH